MWFTLWTVLVIGSLLTTVVLWRRLGRQARELGAELARAGDVNADLARRAAELSGAPVPAHVPGVLRDAQVLHGARATRVRVRAARAARSHQRLARVTRHWRRLGLVR